MCLTLTGIGGESQADEKNNSAENGPFTKQNKGDAGGCTRSYVHSRNSTVPPLLIPDAVSNEMQHLT